MLGNQGFKITIYHYQNFKDGAKLLLTNGAHVGIKNNEGWKSLHEAISVGDRQMSWINLRNL